ncbi:hypothetical protein KF840_09095 [bacterium]|nr:hypothetical protein [bacterium]
MPTRRPPAVVRGAHPASPSPPARRRRWGVASARRRADLSLLLYVPLAAALLPSLTLRLWRDVASGDGWGDSFQNLWNLWWVGHALGRGESLYQTDLLFWPERSSLLFHTLTPANGVLSLPLQWLVPGVDGLVTSLNLLTLLSFALTGLAAHLLARDHGASSLGAWSAGFLAMSLPYRFWHLNHLNLLSTQWALFTLLFLDRALTRRAWRSALAAAACAALTTYSDYESAVYTALAAAVLVVWRLPPLLRDRAAARRALAAIALCVGCALVLHLPLAAALWQQRGDPPRLPSPLEAASLSANLLGIAQPAPISFLHQAWPPAALSRDHGLAGDEVSLGPLFLAGLVVLTACRPRRAPLLWLTLGGLFCVLSLGPSLHVGNTTTLVGEMPYAWLLRWLPWLGLGRSPVRMGGMAGLFLAIAFGILVAPRAGAARRPWTAPRLLEIALLAGLVLERYPRLPPAMETPRVPAFYAALASDPEPFAIMPTPVDYYHQQVYMFWQTVHGKPVTSGGGARASAGTGQWLAAYRRAPADRRQALLQQANVRYVVEHAARHDELLAGEPRVVVVPPLPPPAPPP